jgi:hypothetical protein
VSLDNAFVLIEGHPRDKDRILSTCPIRKIGVRATRRGLWPVRTCSSERGVFPRFQL